jgi:hypothetical protein
LREWDRFQRRFSFDEAPVDLHELLRGVVAEIKSEDRPISLGFSPKVGPLCVGTSRPDCRHLLRLLMEDTMDIWMGANGEPPKVSIETEQIDSTAIIRINAAGGGEGNPPDAGSESESLVGATCRSLAIRLGASIRREKAADGRQITIAEFPQSMMNGK